MVSRRWKKEMNTLCCVFLSEVISAALLRKSSISLLITGSELLCPSKFICTTWCNSIKGAPALSPQGVRLHQQLIRPVSTWLTVLRRHTIGKTILDRVDIPSVCCIIYINREW